MLDPQVCKLFGVDEFTQFIMKELDQAEDQLYDPQLTPIRYIEIRSRYDAFKEVRDTYCKFIADKNQKKHLV